MRTVLIAALASVSSLVLATEALAQTVNTQATIAIPNANVNAGAPPGQQQTQFTLPSAFLFATRRAGIGPAGSLSSVTILWIRELLRTSAAQPASGSSAPLPAHPGHRAEAPIWNGARPSYQADASRCITRW